MEMTNHCNSQSLTYVPHFYHTAKLFMGIAYNIYTSMFKFGHLLLYHYTSISYQEYVFDCPCFRWRIAVMEGAYGRLTYELSIHEIVDDSFGVYRCHASTNLGNAYQEIELYCEFTLVKWHLHASN